MNHTLTTYNNLQYNPAEIADFCVVEVYKDEISLVNALGYFIQPLAGVGDVKAAIKARVQEKPQTGYDNLVILAGRSFNTFNRRIVYAVWYNGTTVPQYPKEPEQHELGAPGDPFDFYKDLLIENRGAPTYCTITLALASLDEPIDFYLNDDYFKIDVSAQIPTDGKILTIDKTGVSYNGTPINTYDSLAVPKLKFGANHLKINKITVDKVKVEYNQKF